MSESLPLRVGTEPVTVLVSDLQQAAANGFSLLNDPRSVPVAGSRVVYRVSADGGEDVPVAVLSASAELGQHMGQRILKALREERHKVRPSDLCTQTALAQRLGYVVNTIYKWSRLPSFPKPVVRIAGHDLWDINDVRRWMKERDSFRRSS